MAAAGYIALLTVITSTICWRLALCQVLGPNDCLISRDDIIPCNQQNPIRERDPVPTNEFIEYRTDFITFTTPQQCLIRTDLSSGPLNSVGSTNQVFVFNSPGIEIMPPRNYRNNRVVEYNFQCDGGRIAFYNITSIELEEKNCQNPNLNNVEVCVDYLQVMRSTGRPTESCGTDVGDNREQLEENSFQAIFRSSGDDRFGGFEGVVICLDPALADEEGCMEVVNDTTTPTPLPDGTGRRKRHIRYSSPQWSRHQRYVTRLRHRHYRTVTVPHGVGVTFSERTLRFTDNRDNLTAIDGLRDIRYILFLREFDGINPQRTFVKTARDSEGNLLRLSGPGTIYYKYGFAYFQRFVINPKGLLPNDLERPIIYALSVAIQDFFRVLDLNLTTTEMPTTEEPTEPEIIVTETVTTRPPGLGMVETTQPPKKYRPYPPHYFHPMKRQVIETGNEFTDDIIRLAIEHENACNPILRASANAILENVDDERVDFLRNQMPTGP